MALITNSVLVSNVRGSVGPDTFSRNRAGDYARQRTTPTFPNTSKQQQANAQITAIKNRWQALTNAARLRWNATAASESWTQVNRIGRPYQCSGYQLFMKLNMSLAYQVIQVLEPPPKAVFPSMRLVSFVTTPSSPQADFTATFSGASFGTDFVMLVHASNSLSVGRMASRPQDYRWIGFFSYADLMAPLNIKWSWYNQFGYNASPNRVFFKCELVSTVSGERVPVGKMGNY